MEFFEWMGQVASEDGRDHCFDGYAQTMLMAALEAIEEFLKSDGEGLNEYFVQKIRWADTDLARYANVFMRMRQFIAHKKAALANPAAPVEAPGEVAMDICDLAHALRAWRRQMHLWHGYFVFCEATWPASRGDGPRAPLVDPTSALSLLDKLQRELASLPRPAEDDGFMESSKARKMLKNFFRRHKAECPRPPRDQIAHAIEALVQDRLFDRREGRRATASASENVGAAEDAGVAAAAGAAAAEPPSEAADEAGTNAAADARPAASQARGGWTVVRFRKRPWASILGDAGAEAAVVRLRLSPDAFP